MSVELKREESHVVNLAAIDKRKEDLMTDTLKRGKVDDCD